MDVGCWELGTKIVEVLLLTLAVLSLSARACVDRPPAMVITCCEATVTSLRTTSLVLEDGLIPGPWRAKKLTMSDFGIMVAA